jgi:hypothetical protein
MIGRSPTISTSFGWDNNVASEDIRPDWGEAILNFIEQARESLDYQSFIAEVDGLIVGSIFRSS